MILSDLLIEIEKGKKPSAEVDIIIHRLFIKFANELNELAGFPHDSTNFPEYVKLFLNENINIETTTTKL